MNHMPIFVRVLAILLVLAGTAAPAAAKGTGYQTGFKLWQGADGDFAGWTLYGVVLDSGALRFDNVGAVDETDPYPPSGYYGGNFYTGGSYRVGEATSPTLPAGFNFSEAIASWNAATPAGTWIETLIRADMGGRWSKWYNLGVWASDDSTIRRHSVRLQGDSDGYVAVDTLVISNKKVAATAFQLKFRLFSVDGIAAPSVQNASLAWSTSAPKKAAAAAGDPALWGTLLDVPTCSQMVYPDGGNVWCSPTSVSMVLGFSGYMPGSCEPRVRASEAGVYDWIYDGDGNWPFNTAFAASALPGMEAYVVRYKSLAEVEPLVKADVPLVLSVAWKKGQLDGSSIPSTAGHLIVLVGFDATGNAIVNDPAAPSDAGVRLVYQRAQLEQLWQTTSGGTTYVIFPSSKELPGF